MSRYAGVMRSAQRFIPAVLAMAFWATNFVFSVSAINAVGPVQLTGARWLLSLILLVPIALFTEHPDWSVIRGEWKLHLVQSILGYSGYTLLLYFALQSTSSFSASIIVALNPAMISIGARLIHKENLSSRAVFGIVVSFIGALVVVLGSGAGGEVSFAFGDLLIVLSSIVWTAYVMISPRVVTPPITATTVQAGMAGLVMIPFMAVDLALGNVGWGTLQAVDWFGILWIGLAPSAAAYFLWNISSEKIGPTKTGAFLNLIPVFTALLVVALGGTITVLQILGGVVVLVGVSVTNSTAQAAK